MVEPEEEEEEEPDYLPLKSKQSPFSAASSRLTHDSLSCSVILVGLLIGFFAKIFTDEKELDFLSFRCECANINKRNSGL